MTNNQMKKRIVILVLVFVVAASSAFYVSHRDTINAALLSRVANWAACAALNE